MRFRKRKPEPVEWEIKVTSTDDEFTTIFGPGDLEVLWSGGDRTNDGYVQLVRCGRVRLWIKPYGWEEPPERLAQLDGTGAIRRGTRWA